MDRREIENQRIIALVEEGLSYPIISNRLGVSIGSLRSRVCRMRKKGLIKKILP